MKINLHALLGILRIYRINKCDTNPTGDLITKCPNLIEQK